MTDQKVNVDVPKGFTLGTLCRNLHEWQETGLSARDKNGRCRQCRIDTRRRWQEKNPEAYKESTQRHRDQYPDRIRQTQRKYARSEQGKRKGRLNQSNRRAKIKRSPVVEKWTTEQLNQRFALFSNSCVYCGKTDNLTIDHFIPLASGGEHTLKNIVPCCERCNKSKSDSDAWTWYTKQVFMSWRNWEKLSRLL